MSDGGPPPHGHAAVSPIDMSNPPTTTAIAPSMSSPSAVLAWSDNILQAHRQRIDSFAAFVAASGDDVPSLLPINTMHTHRTATATAPIRAAAAAASSSSRPEGAPPPPKEREAAATVARAAATTPIATEHSQLQRSGWGSKPVLQMSPSTREEVVVSPDGFLVPAPRQSGQHTSRAWVTAPAGMPVHRTGSVQTLQSDTNTAISAASGDRGAASPSGLPRRTAARRVGLSGVPPPPRQEDVDSVLARLPLAGSRTSSAPSHSRGTSPGQRAMSVEEEILRLRLEKHHAHRNSNNNTNKNNNNNNNNRVRQNEDHPDVPQVSPTRVFSYIQGGEDIGGGGGGGGATSSPHLSGVGTGTSSASHTTAPNASSPAMPKDNHHKYEDEQYEEKEVGKEEEEGMECDIPDDAPERRVFSASIQGDVRLHGPTGLHESALNSRHPSASTGASAGGAILLPRHGETLDPPRSHLGQQAMAISLEESTVSQVSSRPAKSVDGYASLAAATAYPHGEAARRAASSASYTAVEAAAASAAAAETAMQMKKRRASMTSTPTLTAIPPTTTPTPTMMMMMMETVGDSQDPSRLRRRRHTTSVIEGGVARPLLSASASASASAFAIIRENEKTTEEEEEEQEQEHHLTERGETPRSTGDATPLRLRQSVLDAVPPAERMYVKSQLWLERKECRRWLGQVEADRKEVEHCSFRPCIYSPRRTTTTTTTMTMAPTLRRAPPPPLQTAAGGAHLLHPSPSHNHNHTAGKEEDYQTTGFHPRRAHSHSHSRITTSIENAERVAYVSSLPYEEEGKKEEERRRGGGGRGGGYLSPQQRQPQPQQYAERNRYAIRTTEDPPAPRLLLHPDVVVSRGSSAMRGGQRPAPASARVPLRSSSASSRRPPLTQPIGMVFRTRSSEPIRSLRKPMQPSYAFSRDGIADAETMGWRR